MASCDPEKCTLTRLLTLGLNLSDSQRNFLRKNCLPCKLAEFPEDPITHTIEEQTTINEIGASSISQRLKTKPNN